MKEKIKVAILGAGHIAESMSKALAGIPEEAVMYAVASRSMEKAENFAKKFGFEKAYGSYEELAKDEEVDLIYVATPHSEHYANTRLCLMNGRNCLVEKAFCGNRRQAEELVKLAREKKVLLAEAMWTRYMPSVELIRGKLKDGIVGNIHYLESEFSVPIQHVPRLTDPMLAGGALLDLGIYPLTVPFLYLGDDIVKIKTGCTKYETGVDETNETVLVYRDGTMAKVRSSFTEGPSNYAKIVGDKGYMVFGPINAPDYVKVYNPEGELVSEEKIPLRVNGYEYEVLSCKKALVEGKIETDEMPLEETLKVMGRMDTLRKKWGVQYPFETAEDLDIPLAEVWNGTDTEFDDENPWDRSGTRSVLEIYNTETGQVRSVASYDYVIEAPNWSHDGTFLSYNAQGRIWVRDLATGEEREVDSGILSRINNDHVLSPDGRKIVMLSYHKGDLWPGDHVPNKNVLLRMMNADGTGLKVIAEIFGGQGTLNVNSWSPDSKEFAYVRYERIK